MNHFSVVKRIKLFVRLGSITKSGIRFSHRNWPDEEPAEQFFPRSYVSPKIVSVKDACFVLPSPPPPPRPVTLAREIEPRSGRYALHVYITLRATTGRRRRRRRPSPSSRNNVASAASDDTSVFPGESHAYFRYGQSMGFITIMAAMPVALAVPIHRDRPRR